MGSHSESPSPVLESTLPLLTTFHPIPVDTSPYIKENGAYVKPKHSTPVHYQNKQELEQQSQPHPAGIFCGSPASSTGIQCACLTATFKKTTTDVCDCLVANSSPVAHQCLVNHCATTEHEVTCYGDLGKRPCSIPVPFHGAHSMTTTNCCRHHPNSYLCLYMPSTQHTIPQWFSVLTPFSFLIFQTSSSSNEAGVSFVFVFFHNILFFLSFFSHSS